MSLSRRILTAAAALALAAAAPAAEKKSAAEKKPAAKHDYAHDHGEKGHAHVHTAPHKGTLVVFGEEFAHLEFVLDAGSGKLTAYALDGEAEKPVRLKQGEITVEFAPRGATTQTVTLKPVANPLTGETAKDSSQYEGTSNWLKGVAKFDGAVKALTIKGTDFKAVGFKFPEGNE